MPLMPGLGMGDRLGREQRALERVGRADVGLARALAHRDADAGAGEIDAAAGDHLAAPDQVVDRLGGQDGEIAAAPASSSFSRPFAEPQMITTFVPIARSKSGDEIEHHGLHAVGAENLSSQLFLSRFPSANRSAIRGRYPPFRRGA